MNRKYGLIWQKRDDRDLMYSAPQTRGAAALPPSVDLRPKCPPVVDQGDLGSCTANAIAGAVAFEMMKQGEATMPLSRLFIYYNERVIEGTVSEDAGAEIRDGIKSVNKLGVCPEAEWPYTVTKYKQKPPVKAYSDALKHTATSYLAIDNTKLYDIKSCVAGGSPVVMGFNVYDTFESDAVAASGILNLPAKHEKSLGGHAVVIVGYNDALYSGKGGFIIRNSWGSSWGMNGYFTMPYAYATDKSLASDFWCIKLTN